MRIDLELFGMISARDKNIKHLMQLDSCKSKGRDRSSDNLIRYINSSLNMLSKKLN